MAVRCATCDQMFATQEELRLHTDAEHEADDGRSVTPEDLLSGRTIADEDAEAIGARFPCPKCGVELSSQDSLDMHLHDAHAA